jgi:tripartite-type tricarboxylate transporter receptor subunit TctC
VKHRCSSFGGIDQFVKDGKLRALAVTSAKRTVHFADVPTVADAVPGYETDGWHAIAAQAGAPDDIVKRLENEIRERGVKIN